MKHRHLLAVCGLLAICLTGCTPPDAQQTEQGQEAVGVQAPQEFLDTLTLEDLVTVVDDESQTIVLRTLDETELEQFHAYCTRVLDNVDGAELKDATVSSTLIQYDPTVERIAISDFEEYLFSHSEIPDTGLTDQNFCYRMKKHNRGGYLNPWKKSKTF